MMTRRTLMFPKHRFQPEEWLGFTETRPFSRLWSKLLLTDEDLLLVQLAILCDPTGPPVVEGTGGLRKLRFSPRQSATGKRDAFRVCYVYFEEFKAVFLVLVYPKSKKDDLSAKEKKTIRQLIENIARELQRE